MTHLQAPSLYERLQLHPTASQQEIEAAYQRMQAAKAHERFEIDQAYVVLRDPASRSAYDAMIRESVEPPEARPLLRLYGLLSGIVGLMRHFRINFIPLNWVVAVVFFTLGVFVLVDSLIPGLTEPTPTQTSITRIIARSDDARYVTLTGKVYTEPLYVEKMKYSEQNFYGMSDGKGLLLVSHTRPQPGSMRLTGRLVEMDSDLQRMLQEDTARLGLPVEKTYYLDAAPRTIDTASDLLILAFMLGVATLMVIPGLRDYTAFAPAQPSFTPAPKTLLPQPVQATGRYRNAKGKAHFHVGAKAVLLATDDPENPYLIHTRFTGIGHPEGVPHQILLPRGTRVDWGYDYALGRAKPSLLIQGPSDRALLTLDDAHTAAGLAALLRRDLH